jgi:hypothetical protein
LGGWVPTQLQKALSDAPIWTLSRRSTGLRQYLRQGALLNTARSGHRYYHKYARSGGGKFGIIEYR